MKTKATETEIDPAIFSPVEAAKLVNEIEPLLKQIEGKTGPAAYIRAALESARDIARNACRSDGAASARQE